MPLRVVIRFARLFTNKCRMELLGACELFMIVYAIFVLRTEAAVL